jgi:hypothetical protein
VPPIIALPTSQRFVGVSSSDLLMLMLGILAVNGVVDVVSSTKTTKIVLLIK